MSLNVAMVVYDKINLQNSLDLATYYGAKKQAEVLNAMAHINYQMRQNWKLLAWRYRILGTLAQYTGDHNNIGPKDYWCPQNTNNDTRCDLSPNNTIHRQSCQLVHNNIFQKAGIYTNYCDINYFTCISSDIWARGVQNSDLNMCRTADVQIKPIEKLNLVAPFMPEANIAVDAVFNLIDKANVSCPEEGALNWLTVQLFLTHFRLDQKDRKVMIKEIYERTLKVGKDLDGEDIFEGTKKVFKENLTKANQENVENLSNYGLQEFQSFKDEDFEDVFEELHVRPVLHYLDARESGSVNIANCPAVLTPHLNIVIGTTLFSQPDGAKIQEFIRDRLNNFSGLAGKLLGASSLFTYNSYFFDNKNPLAMLTVSFFKKHEKTLYYGLSTEFDYKPENQIFSLNLSSGIRFKGSSFAKAFGGSFGPQPEQSDPFIPTQPQQNTPINFMNVGTSQVKLLSYVHQPNYSRWPGDRWGLVDRQLHDSISVNNQLSFLNKHDTHPNGVYQIKDYFHSILVGQPPFKEPLARNDVGSKSFIRMMEWMAVYPDLYDINHYSILANYHQSYFPKICKLLLRGSNCDPKGGNTFTPTVSLDGNNSFFIRGDFGWPENDGYISLNYNEKRIELSIAPYFLKQGQGSSINLNYLDPPRIKTGTYPRSQLIGRYSPPGSANIAYPLTRGQLFYPWLAGKGGELPDGLLSSWFNPKPLDYKEYKFDNTVLKAGLLKCDYEALKDMPVSSSCVGLGRTGYSVKLISCDAVKRMNPKPAKIDTYCPS